MLFRSGVLDDGRRLIFATSTERLGASSFSLEPGEKKWWHFEVALHLAPGTYHFGAALYRYDMQRDYGQFPGKTVFVHADTDVNGIVNLHPRLLQ